MDEIIAKSEELEPVIMSRNETNFKFIENIKEKERVLSTVRKDTVTS